MNTIDQMWFHIQVVKVLKRSNMSFHSVMLAEQDRDSFAKTARERIIKRAIQSLTKDGIGIGASFVRNIVKVNPVLQHIIEEFPANVARAAFSVDPEAYALALEEGTAQRRMS